MMRVCSAHPHRGRDVDIPVLVEPHPPGFRASTGGPLDLTADGPTPEAALDALRGLVADRLKAGAQLRAMTFTDVHSLIAAARRVGENPMFEEFVKAIEEYRRENNTVPDPD